MHVVKMLTPGFVFFVVLTLMVTTPSDAAGPKNCTKGIPCGNTCIAADKICRVGSSGGSSAPPTNPTSVNNGGSSAPPASNNIVIPTATSPSFTTKTPTIVPITATNAVIAATPPRSPTPGPAAAVAVAPVTQATTPPTYWTGPNRWRDGPSLTDYTLFPRCPIHDSWLLLYWVGADGVGIEQGAPDCRNVDVYWAFRSGRWMGYSVDAPQASDKWNVEFGEAHFVHGRTTQIPAAGELTSAQ